MAGAETRGTGNPEPPTGVLGHVTTAGIRRRTILQGGVVGAALLTSCSAKKEADRARSPRPSPTPSGTTTGGTTGATVTTTGSTTTTTGSAADSTPPESAWRALAAGLDGDLVRPGDSDYAEAKELFNPRWDLSKPVAVVEATTPEDVSEAIRFAVKYSLGVRPKAGGHSYVGASSATGVIVISTTRMSHVTYDTSTHTATVGAGARSYPIHSALAAHGRTIPTGTCPTVGVTGLTLGGGLGIASTGYGVTCDQLYTAKIVTADGVIRTASSSVNPTLLWALRGGGGGNFGIVTSFGYHTQPTTSLGFFLLSFSWAHAAAVIRGWSTRVKAMRHSTWANLHLAANSDKSSEVRIVGVCAPGQETAEAHAMEAAIGYDATSSSLFTKSYLESVQFLGAGTTSPRQGWAAGSDILPTMTTTASAALVKVIADRAASGKAGVAILDPLTGAVQSTSPTATAFPWRRHLCDIQWYLGMPEHPTLDEIHAAYDWIATGHESVASLSSGGYVNYLEPRRHVSSYYGGNFARLQSAKRTYDPHDLFTTPWSIPT